MNEKEGRVDSLSANTCPFLYSGARGYPQRQSIDILGDTYLRPETSLSVID